VGFGSPTRPATDIDIITDGIDAALDATNEARADQFVEVVSNGPVWELTVRLEDSAVDLRPSHSLARKHRR